MVNFEAARAYGALGWYVFPVIPKSKCPYAGSHGVNDSTIDPIEIAGRWSAHPAANIGVDCGRSGIVAIDIDGVAGEETMAELLVAHGSLTDTVEALTPGGGRHLLFQHPGGYIGSRAGLYASIDVRANGGYIVVAPSNHPSGREYRWAPERSPFECGLAEMPAWLVAACRQGSAHPAQEAAHIAKPRAPGQSSTPEVTPAMLGALITSRVRGWLSAG